MANKIEALLEKRESATKEVIRLRDVSHDSDHDWSSEDERQWTEANESYTLLSRQIETEERATEVVGRATAMEERRVNTTPGATFDNRSISGEPRLELSTKRGTIEQRNLALKAWSAYGTQGFQLSGDQKRACQAIGVDPAQNCLDFELRREPYRQVKQELRMSTAATEGAEFVPEGFVNSVEIALLDKGAVRSLADVIRTSTGNDLPWPTVDDTSNDGVIEGEEDALAVTDVVTAATVLGAFKYSSDIIKVSNELLQDSAFDMSSLLGTIMGERITRKQNIDFTIGTGTGQPLGIIAATAAGKTTATASIILAEELIDVLYSVDGSYRNASGAAWQFADTTIAYIRKLRNLSGGAGTGDFIWQPAFMLGQPEMLLGKPLFHNNDIVALGAAKKVGVFGDFSKYRIRDVAGVRVRRLVELYAANDQVGFVTLLRSDGDLIDGASTHIAMKHLITAA